MPKGKTAIVPGSTSGIGLGIARALAGAGCRVMLNGFGEAAAIERERSGIANEFGVRAIFHPADLSKPSEIGGMVDLTIKEFGQVDILVNNTGIQHTAPVEQFPPGLVASVEKSAYVAAEHGVIGLTKVVALETATTGITCNAMCPGWVLTPLVQKQIDERARRENMPVGEANAELLAEKQPSHQFATPGQLGALAVFLCTNAAAQITGAALPVDSGWTAQ